MQAALNGTAALSGGITFVQKPEASLNAFGTLVSDLKIAKTFESSLNANGTLVSNATIAKNLASSLTSSNSLAANALVSKLASASLTGAGTTAANLTVNTAASLLLDLYPSAAAAYSLRKLRTAYTGSAVRVRASTSGAEGDVSFDVNNTISASSTVTVTAVGTSGLSIEQQVTFSTFWNAGGSNQNVFVTTWYDQSGNANNAFQTTAASQPIIVLSGAIQIQNNSNCINFTASNLNFLNLTYYLSGSAGSRFAILKLKQRPVSQASSGLPLDEIGSSSNASYYTNTNGPIADDFASTTRKDPAGDISTNILTSKHIYTTISIPNKFTNWANNNEIFNTNTNTVGYKSTGGTPRIGSGLGFVTNFIDGYLFEIIVYTSDQSTNRTGIQTNINTHYAIY
jgi:hypothetical protein